jgi:hypothetical protein
LLYYCFFSELYVRPVQLTLNVSYQIIFMIVLYIVFLTKFLHYEVLKVLWDVLFRTPLCRTVRRLSNLCLHPSGFIIISLLLVVVNIFFVFFDVFLVSFFVVFSITSDSFIRIALPPSHVNTFFNFFLTNPLFNELLYRNEPN